MRMDIAHGMSQFSHLALAGLHDARIRVPRGRNAKRGRQVEISISSCIPDLRATRPLPDDRPRAIRFDECHVARFVALEQVEDLERGHGLRSHTPLWSGGQINLCIWSWKRTGSASAMMRSTSSSRE